MTATQTALDEFLLSRQANGAAATTVRWYGAILKQLAVRFPTLETVDTHALRQYIVEVRQTKAQATAVGTVTALHAFWAWAAFEYQFFNPMLGIKRARPAPAQPRGAAHTDVMKLLEHASIRDATLICFLYDTGARLGGAVNLLWEWVDLDRQMAVVIEKGQKSRKIHFCTFTARLLQKWRLVRDSDSPYVFTNERTGGQLTPSGMAQIFKRLKRRAGVQGRVNPHSFRHAFAREYVRTGGDVVTLARLLGHEDVSTTAAYYAVFSADELAEFHEKHSPLRGMK